MTIPVSTKRTHFHAMQFCEGLPDNEKMVFEIKIIPARKISKLIKLFANWSKKNDESVDYDKVLDKQAEVCEIGIAGWRNVYDEDGNEVVYSKEAVKHLPEYLSGGDMSEIADAIIDCNTLSLTNKKN